MEMVVETWSGEVRLGKQIIEDSQASQVCKRDLIDHGSPAALC